MLEVCMKNLLFLVLCIGLGGCQKAPTPKKHSYFRIDFPEKDYTLVEEKGRYSFELPHYAHWQKEDTSRYAWQNIYFPQQNGQLHLSYFPLKNNLAEYIEDTHKFVYKHTIKADAIRPNEYSAPERKVYGILYNIDGNTASSVQFFVTDSMKHFLRGSLYLNEKPNKDSLDIVIDFLAQDVVRLMQTIEWK